MARLAEVLRTEGIDVWWDQSSLKPGGHCQDVIEDAITQGDFLIACFSKQYEARAEDVGGTYMNKELAIASEKMLRLSPKTTWLIPVWLSKCNVPLRLPVGYGRTLRDLQFVDLSKPRRREEGLRTIVATIKSTPSGTEPDPPMPERLMEAFRQNRYMTGQPTGRRLKTS